VSDSNLGLEDLLQRRLPSAVTRADGSLASAGIADTDLAGTKDAVAALGLTTAPAAPPADLRARLLASHERGGRYGIFADRIARLFDLSLPDAEALMKRVESASEWNAFLVEGVEMIPVAVGPKCKGAIATLVRLQPGVTFPEHTHRGDETMHVLDGGFREHANGGEEAWRGDELLRADGSDHALMALPGVPCIAAVLIVGRVEFR